MHLEISMKTLNFMEWRLASYLCRYMYKGIALHPQSILQLYYHITCLVINLKFLIKLINLYISSYIYIKGVVHLYCYLYIVGLCATLLLFVFGNSCSMGISNLPINMPKVRQQQTPGLRAYISDKSWVPILQVILRYHFRHSHFQHSKNCTNLQLAALPICIAAGIHCDYGIFILTFSCLFKQCIVEVPTMGFKLNMCYSFYLKASTQK